MQVLAKLAQSISKALLLLLCQLIKVECSKPHILVPRILLL